MIAYLNKEPTVIVLGETEFHEAKEGRGSRTFIFTDIITSVFIESVIVILNEWDPTSGQDPGLITIEIVPDEAGVVGIVAVTKEFGLKGFVRNEGKVTISPSPSL
jgi:hypothetical protein